MKRLKKNLTDVSVYLNANRKVHMGLKIKIISFVYMTKKQIKYLNVSYYMIY